ncbi:MULTISPECIES: uracil-DNA glycosylase family protein [unclassified Thalassospira]|uniref:uracil-DNA glycosylase family protein n=1 Tax=unclassified Thalassospira TaxID=2648997 RepID=UPI0009D4AED3|nr:MULTISPECIES: uracil-DNA glycosylase family protein [unclassified Thalassospira]ONH88972.1 IclR family transcriptional regulator [Thalassospira sp. MCCC 1A02803]|tara:strand:+ start:579 stop:1214 length:636 start_codon:yes stop_codon:yes gene_type:complete
MPGLTGKLPEIDPMGGDAALDRLLSEVRECRICAEQLPLGPRPVVRMAKSARILVIGQAPGTRVHETGLPWNDASGDRLRDWLGLSVDDFYDPAKLAIMPMGFCYPGRFDRGGDLPPRPECAPTWHDALMRHLPDIGLTLLIGQYAQERYLGPRRAKTMTETVHHFADFLPDGILPMPHPSWRNTAWMKKNPWFEADLLPVLQSRVHGLLT